MLMSLDKLDDLDDRVRKLIQEVIGLRQANALLKEELERAHESNGLKEAQASVWEEERTHIRGRIEKVLEELDIVDCENGELQEAVHGDQSY